MKKQALVISCLAIALVLSQSYPLKAESFEGREDEMNKKCSAIYDEETQSECKAYKDYLVNKKDDADKTVNKLKDQIATVQGDITKINDVITQNNEELKEAQKVLESIESAVVDTNASITKLKTQIKEKEESIKERDRQMKERLLEMQPYIGSNHYIDFLMGASSFTDLLRRTSIVGELNSYEKEMITTLNKEKKELKLKQEDVTLKKELLEVQQKDAKVKADRVASIKANNEELIGIYRKQEVSLLEEKRRAQVASGQYASSIPTIDLSILPDNWGGDDGDSGNDGNIGDEGSSQKPTDDGNQGNTGSDHNSGSSGGSSDTGGSSQGGSSGNSGGSSSQGPQLSTGFIQPVQGTAYYSAGTWAYANGAQHLGMDMGTYEQMGLPLVAPATGIIVAVNDGDWPNHGPYDPPTAEEQMAGYPYGAGNGLHMIVNVNGISYGISFYHLTTGSFTVNVGDIVKQGQMIARTGNAGNSWGPHCHIEMTNLGKVSINKAVEIFTAYGKDYFYGNYNVSGNCANKGSTPCLVRPEEYIPH